ncbi:MAG TPA: TA system VapC family ribonuclease toxin [Thermoanaerobaculia bacterium]|nr:TA system VapC family ribonuclease toxin [Thermoanaerobaculia bacterium]
MIAVDTNLLVYAHRRDSPWFEPAQRALRPLIEGAVPWGIPWPCIHEFLAISTHPKIYRPPTELPRALEQVAALLASPGIILLSEAAGYWPVLERLLVSGQIIGARVHDARIAALCLFHGVSELWSFDRDFTRFPELKTRNPLVSKAPA